ncbi:MAG TPA: XRE family transcriptional regulator, partial [Gemmatimonadales bacterium]|nr:XRE family transcriptional regulator [Gemmatimonadales bacterium]
MGDGAADINRRIAARVRGLRAGRGLSLEALARHSGVSRSMISLIERGEASATAVVLEKLAASLGVSLAALFDDPQAAASPVARRQDQTQWRDPASGYRRRNLSPPGMAPLQLVEVELPAGARVAYESAVREVPMHQQVWVLDGSVEVTLGDARHRLEAGDCLAMQLTGPTAYRNPGRKAARYLVAITGNGHATRRRP